MYRLFVASALCFASFAPAAIAGTELTLSAGLRTGEVRFTTEATSPLIVCVTTPCVTADVSTEEEQMRLSLIVDVPVSPGWMVELLYTEQDGDHEFRSDFPGIVERGSYEWTTVQAGALRQWGVGRLRPFAVAAFGATRFESVVPAYDRPFFPGIIAIPVDEEVLSGSLACGLKIELGRNIDLRLESRGWWHDFPDRLGGSLWQAEANVGLSYRW